MPLGLRKFKIGGVEYPLTDVTTNGLLQDGDPALYYALDLFETVINEYVGDRLLAQAALLGYSFPAAVAHTIHYEPSPFLMATDMVFPLLALYRSEEAWDRHAVGFDKSNSVWTWLYLLPPLGGEVEIAKLDPILHNVAAVVQAFAMQSFDPNWESGATLRDKAGIQSMLSGPVKYLDVELLDGDQNKWWRGVSGKLLVQEQIAIVESDLDTFEGANIKIDLDAPEGKVEALVEADTFPPPVLTQILPDSGTKAGGAYFEVVGTGFRPGTPAKVLIGGAYAGSVYVASPFKVTGLTPEHAALPTYAADVQVIDVDGQASNVLSGAYTFTTP